MPNDLKSALVDIGRSLRKGTLSELEVEELEALVSGIDRDDSIDLADIRREAMRNAAMAVAAKKGLMAARRALSAARGSDGRIYDRIGGAENIARTGNRMTINF